MSMYSPEQLHDYQKMAVYQQYHNSDSMLWLDMGLGKTVITLTTIDYRMRQNEISKALIFGPLRVIHTVWEKEARKWEHLKHLRFQIIHGSENKKEQRLFNNDVDIHLINYENMAWLASTLDRYFLSQQKKLPWQMVVYDEVTKVKKSNTVRMSGGKKRLKKSWSVEMRTLDGIFVLKDHCFHRGDSILFEKSINCLDVSKEYFVKHITKDKFSLHHDLKSPSIPLPLMNYTGKLIVRKTKILKGWNSILTDFSYRTGLTGTPAPNGYVDLHGQYLAVDGGKRLGWFFNQFSRNYLTLNFNGFGYKVTEVGIKMIEKQIKDITIKMSASDYLTLPDSVVNDIIVELPLKIREQYDTLEKELFVELDERNDIEVFNTVSLSNKCLQFSNGSPYLRSNEPEWYPLHDAKLKALESILEEAYGSPVLVAYLFKPDAERIMVNFKRFKPVNITETKPKDLARVIQNIIDGKHLLIVGHPASMGHGIDRLQDVIHIGVWFGLNWNLEFYQQFMGRYIRQGQKKTTFTHRIMCNNTMDEAVRISLENKSTSQEDLKKAIDQYRGANM